VLADEEWLDRLDATIRDSVRSQLVSDVPLGAFLSGGVDSSLVVASMGGVETFSIGFEDPTYNETEWSKRVADHLGVSHRVMLIEPNALDLFERLMQYMDDPIGDFSIFPTYLVSKLAAERVKVVLSGDGGDELFGGYETYVAQQAAAAWDRLPRFLRANVIAPIVDAIPPMARKKGLVNKIKRFVEGARLDGSLGHARWRLFCDEALRATLFSPQALGQMTTPVGQHIVELMQRSDAMDSRDQALYVDFRSYLVDNCLTKVDRMSMACSIEARVPLLDKNVVELAFMLPPHLKLERGRTKVALKSLASRYVPRECVYRPKEGFSIPIKNWLKHELSDTVMHYLDPARLAAAGLVRPEIVTRLLAEHRGNRANHSHVLWSLLVFEHWRERWGISV
jgi:asparagine synthase (glutamine-hydrolysing)